MAARQLRKKIKPAPAPQRKKPGRKKGQQNKETLMKKELREIAFNDLIAAAQAGAIITPLGFFLQTLTDPRSSWKRKAWAADKAAPYLHRRMPLAIDGGEGKPIMIATSKQLQAMDPELLAQLASIVDKLDQGQTVEGVVTSSFLEEIGVKP